MTSAWIEEISRDSTGREVEHRRKLGKGNGITRKLPGRSAARDYLFDRVRREPSIVRRQQRRSCFLGREHFAAGSAAAPTDYFRRGHERGSFVHFPHRGKIDLVAGIRNHWQGQLLDC